MHFSSLLLLHFVTWLGIISFRISFANGLEQLLIWREGTEYSPKFFLHEEAISHVIVDAASREHTTLKISGRLKEPPVIRFKCFVETLRLSKVITEATFCKDEICVRIQEKFQFKNNIQFTATFDPQRGAEITSDWRDAYRSKNRPDFSGSYWCEFGNPHAHLRSSILVVEDVIRPFISMGSQTLSKPKVIPMSPIEAKDLPVTLACPLPASAVPQKLDTEYSTNPLVNWLFCSTENKAKLKKCMRQGQDPAPTPLQSVFREYSLHSNGSLTIFVVDSRDRFSSHALFCYDSGDLYRIYGIYGGVDSTDDNISPLIFDATKPYVGPPLPIGPMSQTIRIREGLRPVEYILTAMIRCDHSKLHTIWRKDGVMLPIQKDIAGYQYKYSLSSLISRAQAGTYTLHVVYETKVDYLTFVFYVIVEYPPVIMLDGSNANLLNYVMEGHRFQTHITLNNTNRVSFFINGLNLTQPSRQEQTATWLKSMHLIKLTSLNFSVNPYPLPNLNKGAVVTYTTQALTMDSSHVLSLEAFNHHSLTRVNQVIRIVPLPLFLKTPNMYSCINNCDLKAKKSFVCSLELFVKEAIIKTGVHLSQSWLVNGEEITEDTMRDDKLFQFFHISNTSEVLTINPLINDDMVLQQRLLRKLRNATISCVMEIFTPSHFPPKGISSPRLYDSRNEARMKIRNSLEAHMVFYLEDDFGTASMSWLWPTIFAIVILFIVAILFTYMCIRNREGATYLVDKQERAQGKDPEKEIIEKEAFPTYERNDSEWFVYGSRNSLNNSVGFHSVNDEDSQLDPGNFNEDASFVNKYGRITHNPLQVTDTLRRPLANGKVNP